MSGAAVHIWCHWVSHFSLCRLGILSTPFGVLPLWEVSHLRVSHSSVHIRNIFPPQTGFSFMEQANLFGWGTLLERGIVFGLYLIWEPVHLGELGMVETFIGE